MEKQASATAATVAKKESIWRDRFARHATSKQSVEAFCRSDSVSSALFYQWRKRLDINAVNPALAMRTPPAAPTFIDLGPANVNAYPLIDISRFQSKLPISQSSTFPLCNLP